MSARSWSSPGAVGGLLIVVASHVMSLGDAAHAQRVIPSDVAQYFNRDRRVRVESATIVVIEGARTATLYFQAAAMVRARFPGDRGPWVRVALVDSRGVQGPDRQVIVASVGACGGYQNHSAPLHPVFPIDEILRARSFTILMPGGASPVGC